MRLIKIDFSIIYNLYKENIERKFQNLKDNDKQRLIGYVYIILTLLSISISGLFAIDPTLSTISNLKKQFEDDKLVKESLRKKIDALSELSQQYKQIESDLEMLDSAIPASSEIPDFTGKVQKITAQNNLTLKKFNVNTIDIFSKENLSPKYGIKKEENNYFTVNMDAEGNEKDISNFLSDIINIDRLVTIDVIDLIKASNNFVLNIKLKVYFSK